MGKTIAVTSGKGGTGKSTVSVGLALGFASFKKSVLLIDMDEGLRCLDLMLGIDKELVFDLSDALAGRDWKDAVYSAPANEFISLIPAPNKLGSIPKQAFSSLLEEIYPEYDVIILDFPAGIDFELYTCLPRDTQFIAVCSPDPVSVRDAAIVCNNLPNVSHPPVLILNKFVRETMRCGIHNNIDDIIDASGFRLLGVVPEDTELLFLSVRHKLKHRKRVFKAFARIAGRLNGERIPLPKFKKI